MRYKSAQFEQIHQTRGVSEISTGELHRTAFDTVQREAGATWTDWEGWAWAADFGDPVRESQATRTACSLWDESPLRKWDLRGRDAVALADALFTNDMAALEDGQVRYGALCDEQGKMVMDGTIFRLADDHCLSVTSYDSDLDWFRKVASDRGLEVEIEDRTAQMPHLQVQGPKAREVLGPITEGADVGTLRYFRFLHEGVRVGGVPCWLSRTGYSGELGFEVYCSVDDAPALWNAVMKAGQPHGLSPIGLSAIEILRIESGLLFPDVDYFPHQTDPFEVRLDKVVKPDKPGDFVGRDALRRIAEQGTPRLLTTLRIDGDQVPEYGAAVTRDGSEVGILRSPCQSPTFDMSVIGMAAIDRDLVQDGQRVDVALGDGVVGATVASFPLYDTDKRRPRS
jgi:glycine cleavage system T protein (aminomethyltransferase)